jgi:predicted lipoprotein with Yx(FWY)xxD motif
MKYAIIALSLAAAATFSGCGGGSGTTSMGGTPIAPGSPVSPVSSQGTAPPATVNSLSTSQFMTASRGSQSGFAAANGFAVYNFDLDLTTPGTSSCTGTCTTFWPPIAVPAGATFTAPFGSIRRPDGTMQLAFNGHPLYTFAQDTNATTASGDGLNLSGGVWHLAQAASLTTVLGPGPTSSPSATSSPMSTSAPIATSAPTPVSTPFHY